jgi:hypothetical protein
MAGTGIAEAGAQVTAAKIHPEDNRQSAGQRDLESSSKLLAEISKIIRLTTIYGQSIE